MRPLRVYVDTSVFGGLFDPEFDVDTRVFFDAVNAGRFHLVVSDQVTKEIDRSPQRVRNFFGSYFPQMDLLKDSTEVQQLADSYLRDKILTPKSWTDASHVAYATIHSCVGLVSWNYRHIVHEDKCMLFNVVNASQGYPPLFIADPREILNHGQER